MFNESQKLEILRVHPDANAIYNYLNCITDDATVKDRVNNPSCNEAVILVRGCSREEGSNVVNSSQNPKSVRGIKPNENCGRPTAEQARRQVGGSQVGIKGIEKYPEFTADIIESIKWAKGGGWLFIKILPKYLTRGDTGQKGWCCLPEAPIEAAFFVNHPKPGKIDIRNCS